MDKQLPSYHFSTGEAALSFKLSNLQNLTTSLKGAGEEIRVTHVLEEGIVIETPEALGNLSHQLTFDLEVNNHDFTLGRMEVTAAVQSAEKLDGRWELALRFRQFDIRIWGEIRTLQSNRQNDVTRLLEVLKGQEPPDRSQDKN